MRRGTRDETGGKGRDQRNGRGMEWLTEGRAAKRTGQERERTINIREKRDG